MELKDTNCLLETWSTTTYKNVNTSAVCWDLGGYDVRKPYPSVQNKHDLILNQTEILSS